LKRKKEKHYVREDTVCRGKNEVSRYKMKEYKSRLVIFYLIKNRVSPKYTHNSRKIK
jgi:hypothetical protein